ncbi:MAG: hypothetical protein B6242_12985 [Anaerolineaceae bacterium 4572_78]|nr:MAG: hypothetical protein B6242_12985 [Anaerolineaceae bacterium 4572_78]
MALVTFSGMVLLKVNRLNLPSAAKLNAWGEIATLKKNISRQEKARSKVYKEQEHGSNNMKVLASTGEEGKLRSRYVKKLSQSEDALAKIAQTIAKLEKDIQAKESKIENMIAALN